MKALFMEIETFDDLCMKGPELVTVFNDVWEKYYCVLPKSLQAQVVIFLLRTDGRRFRYRFNEKNWAKSIGIIGKGSIEKVSLCKDYDNVHDEFGCYFAATAFCGTEKYLTSMGFNQHATDCFYFSMDEDLFEDGVTLDIQKNWLKFFKYAFVKLNGTVGRIEYGENRACLARDDTAIECLVGKPSALNSEGYGKYTYGYYWGNIISEGHVETLGGFDRVLREAPGICEVLSFGDRRAVYLQLTPDIRCFDKSDLRRLRDFFCPILQKVDKSKLVGEHPTVQSAILRDLVFD